MQPLLIRLILLLPVLWVLELFAQPQIKSFTKDDGLSSNYIVTSLVDSKGIVWVGCVNGVSAYAGNEWHSIKNIEQKNTSNLQSIGKVHLIYEDRKQNIWVASEKGLFLYNREYWTYFQSEEDENYLIEKFFEDRLGNLWVIFENFQDLTNDMGFSLVSGKLQCLIDNRWYRFDEDVAGTAVLKSYTPEHYITDYLQDHLGNVWFTTLEGVFVFDGITWKSYKEDVFNAKETYAILEDDHYDIWIGTENGISRFHDGNWITYRKKEGLNANNVYRIEKDLLGRIWAWSKNNLKFCGLSLYDNESWESFDQKDFKLKEEVENHIMLNDTMLVFANDGLAMFSQSGWHHFNQKDGLSDRHYNQLFVDRKSQTWLAGESGLFRYEKGSWKLEVPTQNKCMPTKIFVDKQGRVWAGTSCSGVYLIEFGKHSYFDEADGLSGGAVSDIFEDKFGNTWVITKKGITKFDWSFAKR